MPELLALSPDGRAADERQPGTPTAASLLRDLDLPDWRDYAVDVPAPGTVVHEATRVLGAWLRDVTAATRRRSSSSRPDELASNRLQAVLEVTGRRWDALTGPGDDHLDPHGRVIEMLSEHVCQGLLEGYLLTGRHGVFTCYEAFIHIVDSMFNQHAKWLEASARVPWRRPLASLNYLLSSHVWRQDHNGFTPPGPGLPRRGDEQEARGRARVPPARRQHAAVDLRPLPASRHYVNVVVAGKQPRLTGCRRRTPTLHCTRGVGIWEWAGTEQPQVATRPDVVLACAGDVPTLETLAAASILRERLPDLSVRVVNIVDLMRLLPDSEHPHGLPDREFDTLFTTTGR